MKRFGFAILFATGALILMSASCHAYTSPGKPTGYVTDFAHALKPETVTQLNAELDQFKKDTGHEIAVAIIPTLSGDDIESYSNTLFREWGVGTKQYNNGVLFVVAVNDHQMRIEVGYGLEGALTDLESSWILDNQVRPQFKAGDYDAGITDGVKGIEDAIQGEVIPAAAADTSSISPRGIEYAIFFGFYVLAVLSRFLARKKSWWWLGGVIGAIVGLIVGLIYSWLWWILILGIAGLIWDLLIIKFPPRGGPSIWGGFGGGFGGGGGGGFGGFGGGSSGGGGSSSSW